MQKQTGRQCKLSGRVEELELMKKRPDELNYYIAARAAVLAANLAANFTLFLEKTIDI